MNLIGILDPFIFVCPEINSNKNEINSYFRNILDWYDLKEQKWMQVSLSENAPELLAQNNDYPLSQKLNNLIHENQLEYVSPDVIMRIMNSIFKDENCLEKYISENSIADYQIEKFHFTSNISRPNEYLLHLQQLIGIHAVLKFIVQPSINSILITKHIPTPVSRINFSGSIQYLKDDDSGNLQEKVIEVGQISMVDNVEAFCNEIKPVNVWIIGNRIEAFKKAVETESINYFIAKGQSLSTIKLNEFSFGRKFYDSCMPIGFLNEPTKVGKLIKALCDLVVEDKNRKYHEFRVHKGPTARQEMRGDWKAFRMDIDHEFHLQFWKLEKRLEFSNVEHHGVFRIYK
ncbi:hypothetical protein [Leptospira andrefontaineae]|uniref:Uncharacterized protein n=1 Tax=Leptospira andrefontaineae TaxID=2484976 RepID=A0A4R9H6Q7_9LEPT|nr:hypothetical protein [Leptospira andrefontaineae]TGK41274.1 hypothetical protein EHO65_07560 [Leptospira andrefontaineae]